MHIQGHEFTKRRLPARHAQPVHRHFQAHAVRRPALGRKPALVARAGIGLFIRFALVELDVLHDMRGIHDRGLAGGVEGHTAPLHAAGTVRIGHRALALRCGRRIHAAVVELIPQPRTLAAADDVGEFPDRRFFRLVEQWCGLGGERLGGRIDLAGDRTVAGGHRAFLDRPYVFAGLAIDHEQKTHLGRLDQGRDVFAIHGDVHERGRGVDIVIPDIVMHPLARPYDLARIEIQRGGRGRQRRLFLAIAAPEVRRRRRYRHIHQPEFFVGRHMRPHVGRAAVLAHLVGKRLERPFALAGTGIDREHRAGRGLFEGPVLAGPAQQQMIANHGGRLQQRQRPLGVGVVPLIDVEHAVIGKTLAFFTGIGIEREQACVHRAHVDDLLAGLARHRLFGRPVGYAPVLEHRLGQGLLLGVGIERPLRFAGGRIEGDQSIERRADIERVVGKDRRRRPDRRGCIAAAVGDVAGMKFPDLFEPGDIVRGDLAQRAVFLCVELAMKTVPGGLGGHQRRGRVRSNRHGARSLTLGRARLACRGVVTTSCKQRERRADGCGTQYGIHLGTHECTALRPRCGASVSTSKPINPTPMSMHSHHS